MTTQAIDDPATLAEVTTAFDRYEAALGANDVRILDELFWDSAKTIRYGAGENLYGSAEVAAFRAARPFQGLARRIFGTVLTTFGTDAATASTMFRRASMPGKLGRQMQTWVRMPQGWRIVAAHVSFIDDPDGTLGGRHEHA